MIIDFNQNVEELFKKYILSSESYAKDALSQLLIDKKRKYKIELNQFYRKYKISNSGGLENMIRLGKVPEHPAWEDLIEIENLLNELSEIEKDLAKLS
ncbi:MAG: hypothetical protein ACYCVH_10275 [Ignavibacteriaceae bacterium]